MQVIDWNDDKIVAKVTRAAEMAVGQALAWAQGEARQKMNTSNNTTKQARLKQSKWHQKNYRGGLSTRLWSSALAVRHSRPFQYPFKGTGHLQAAVGYEVVPGMIDKTVRGKFGLKAGRLTSVQSDIDQRSGKHTKKKYTIGDYALWLEFGTSHMAPRPYIRPTIQKNHKVLEQRMIATFKRVMA